MVSSYEINPLSSDLKILKWNLIDSPSASRSSNGDVITYDFPLQCKYLFNVSNRVKVTFDVAGAVTNYTLRSGMRSSGMTDILTNVGVFSLHGTGIGKVASKQDFNMQPFFGGTNPAADTSQFDSLRSYLYIFTLINYTGSGNITLQTIEVESVYFVDLG